MSISLTMGVVGILAAAPQAEPGSPSAAAFLRLQGLAGEWAGTFEWSGGRADKGDMRATYSITGNGSAVVEDLQAAGTSLMSSVYHLDHDDLRMTHYCAAKNQPRLKATDVAADGSRARFEFIDATNLATPQAPHVVGFDIEFPDPRHVVLIFRFRSDATTSTERIDLRRAA